MEIITSSNHKIVKKIKNLHKKSFRNKSQQFFIEGLRIIEDAVSENVKFDALIVSRDFLNSNNRVDAIINKISAPTYALESSIFNQISDTLSPQGILGIINNNQVTSDFDLTDSKFILLIDRISDPGNLGTIIRTCSASDVSAIVLGKGCIDLFNPKVLRSTMGSVFKIPILMDISLAHYISPLKRHKFYVFSTSVKAEKFYFDVNFKNKSALIIGNESNGISDDIIKLSDEQITIPMQNNVESLNASISAAIILYEYLKQNLIN